MSRQNLEIEQTIVLLNCIINDERYDLVNTPPQRNNRIHKNKRQTLRKKNFNKQKQIIRKQFSKTKKRSLIIRNKRKTITSQFRRLNKKNHQIDKRLERNLPIDFMIVRQKQDQILF